METTSTKTLARRTTGSELMPPPPKRIKRPKNVIDEESYTHAISKIIARDFFPGLLESETKQEYLDAIESNNKAWISSAQRRLEQVMTPGRRTYRRGTSIQTPAQVLNTSGGILGRTVSSISSSTSSKVEMEAQSVDTNMSLDTFQSKYTSEDNESFYKLLDIQNQKKAEKYAWMWTGNNKIPSKMVLKQKEIELKLLKSRDNLEDDGGKIDRLAIRDNSEKPTQSWHSKANNGLMFPPEGLEDSVKTIANNAQNESKAEPKCVLYSNTRLPVSFEENTDYGTMIPPSPSLSAVRSAILGNRRAPQLENEPDEIKTPRVDKYPFVDDEPDIEPRQEIKVFDMGTGDLKKNPFTIKAQSTRENLLHRMVDKNARKKRQSTKNGFTGKVEQTPIPKFPSTPQVKSTQLTPAAQRLWSQVGTACEKTPRVFVSDKQKPEAKNRWTLKPGL
ncbi:Splicing factor ESS-2-like protein [Golovinomyces cichoracearum]|uniref:Splicing factor ESS-2-like protein n=1 Tax=Golovinomyces cichoracearum TaxID=62708 RepID=A0A420HD06_9PEZI|nr:Splicing factor ESS-2-like protein [Golovinomyces cichoracearum]